MNRPESVAEDFGVVSQNPIDNVAGTSLCSPRMSARSTAVDHSITKELVVTNKLGIHARPAAMFVKTANRFECDIFVEKDGEKVNGKSIMGLMMLAAGPGSRLKVQADGDDAVRALGELEGLLHRKFDED
jgi:phosphocarrier protein HPr